MEIIKHNRRLEIWAKVLAIIMAINSIAVLGDIEIEAASTANVGNNILRLDYALIVVPKENHKPANFNMDGLVGAQSSLGQLTPLEDVEGGYNIKYNAEVPLSEYEPRVSVYTRSGNIVENWYNFQKRYTYPGLESDQYNPGISEGVYLEDIQRALEGKTPYEVGNKGKHLESNSNRGKLKDEYVKVIQDFDGSSGNPANGINYPTWVNYPVDVNVILDETNKIDMSKIHTYSTYEGEELGMISEDAQDFRNRAKGNMTGTDYEQGINNIDVSMYFREESTYELTRYLEMPMLSNPVYRRDIGENLALESWEDMDDRISVHEVIIPSIINIDGTRQSDYDSLSKGQSYSYNFFKYKKVGGEKQSKDDPRYRFRDPVVYNDGLNDTEVGRNLDAYEPIGQAPEGEVVETNIRQDLDYNTFPREQYGDGDIVYTDNWHVRNPKERLKETPRNEFGDTGHYNRMNYDRPMDPYHRYGDGWIPHVMWPETPEGIEFPHYPSESIYHSERTIVPKISSPPNIIQGMPIGVLGYMPKDLNQNIDRIRKDINGNEMPGGVIVYPESRHDAEGNIKEFPDGERKGGYRVTFRYELREGFEETVKDSEGNFKNYPEAKEQRSIRDNEDSYVDIYYEGVDSDGDQIRITEKGERIIKEGGVDKKIVNGVTELWTESDGNLPWNIEPARRYYMDSKKRETILLDYDLDGLPIYKKDNGNDLWQEGEVIQADIFTSFELTKDRSGTPNNDPDPPSDHKLNNNPDYNPEYNTENKSHIIIEETGRGKDRIKFDYGTKVREKVTVPRKEIYEKYNTLDEDKIQDTEVPNTPMLDYLLEPEGRIIYTYLDLTSMKLDNSGGEGSGQDPQGKKFNPIEGDYEVVEDWMGTKEIFNQYQELVNRRFELEEYRVTDYWNSGYNTQRVRGSYGRTGINALSQDQPIYHDKVLWSHRTELELQHHAAISRPRSGLYDFSNRENKSTKAGYGVITESHAILQTDWPRSGEIRARAVKSKSPEPMDESRVLGGDIGVDLMQARATSPNRPSEWGSIHPYTLLQTEDESREIRDNVWKSLVEGKTKTEVVNGTYQLVEDYNPPRTIPFDKINDDLKYKIEWSTAPGEFHANPETKSGPVVPAFGDTRQHFIHLDHPNGNFNLESWVTVDFGREYFNVMFAQPLSININGNMFDDSFTITNEPEE